MLRLHALGGLALTHDSTSLSGAALQPRRLAILAILAVAGERGTSRDRLLALLWPERDAASGRQALSQALYALRRDTTADTLVLGVGTERLRLNPDVISADVTEFEARLERDDLAGAMELYVAPFLDGVHLSGDAGPFERWVDEERARLAAIATESLESLATAAERSGDHAAAVTWWRRLTSLDPLRTSATAGLMQALVASGDRAGALHLADVHARLLREELDAAPSADITKLADRLRSEGGDSSFEARHIPAAPGAPPLIAGRYAITREIGEGAMAIVVLARDVKHDRDVALKMLRPELNAAMDRERMLREIRVTARLQHPHILPLHDSGEHDGTLYFVMPYVSGESLRDRLQRDRALPVVTAIRLAHQVADALHHAHRHGIVHRDVKPENVLLSGGDGGETHAIVADFGIVHIVSDSAADRQAQQIVALGTPAYMSPEQITGDAGIDARSDVFALGCMLYEMLAGRPPWLGATPRELLARRFAEAPPPLRSLRPEVPPSIEAAVQRAIALRADDRFAGASDFAQAIAESNLPPPPESLANVPVPPTALVGRARERAIAGALLVRPDVRLLTLTGTGGSGKTSLALQLAADVAPSFEGATFVDLASVRDPVLVVSAIAAALGVRDREDRPLLDATAAAIGARRFLLLLDNVEQVVTAAPEIATLLSRAPRCTVLATSRVRLRVRGEHEFFVAPLDLPDLAREASVEALEATGAVQLFVTCARAADPGFALDAGNARAVAEICVRLDGLPLAIELAAARTRLLSPRHILARLAERRLDLLADGALDLPARQRTLRDAIAWSYELLSEPARTAFRAVGVFAAPFSLDALCAVLRGEEEQALALARDLVDANLVRRAGDDDALPRFALLETIREFALEQLRSAGDGNAIRDRHLAHYLSVAERCAPKLTGDEQGLALARLERERANLRAALEWAWTRSGAGDAARLIALVRALWRAWLVSGRWTEGREWLQRAIIAAEPADTTRAELLAAAGAMAQNQGDYEHAYACVRDALATWRALGDRAGEARALAILGWLGAVRRSSLAEGRALALESLTIYRDLGDERGAAQALSNVAWVTMLEGKYDEARSKLLESLAIRRKLRDRRDIAFTLTTLAWALGRGGDFPRAREALTEALDLFQAIGERQLYAFASAVGAELALLGDDLDGAREFLTEISVPIFRDIGDRWGSCFATGLLGDVELARERHAEARRAYDDAAAIARALGDLYASATLDARRSLVVAATDRDEARALAEQSQRAMAEIGGALPPWVALRLTLLELAPPLPRPRQEVS